MNRNTRGREIQRAKARNHPAFPPAKPGPGRATRLPPVIPITVPGARLRGGNLPRAGQGRGGGAARAWWLERPRRRVGLYYRAVQRAARHLAEHGGGAIVNISSV